MLDLFPQHQLTIWNLGLHQYISTNREKKNKKNKNTLNNMLKDMCHDAGIGGLKTNHSLRATGASELFAADVPEKSLRSRLVTVH